MTLLKTILKNWKKTETQTVERLNNKVEEELKRLQETLSERQHSVQTPEKMTHHKAYNPQLTVWKIALNNGEACFMSQKKDCNIYSTIIVDADKLYYHWLNSGSRHHCTLKPQMQNDHKFKDAIDGFSKGEENPVPAANAYIRMENGNPIVSFGDGITRTFYLLSKGAQSFPLQIPTENKLLAEKVLGIHASFDIKPEKKNNFIPRF